MTVLQWLVACVLGVVGATAIVGNWALAVMRTFGRRRSVSLVPFVGGASLAVAWRLAPANSYADLWWIWCVVDIGCVPMLLLHVGSLVAGRLRAPRRDKK